MAAKLTLAQHDGKEGPVTCPSAGSSGRCRRHRGSEEASDQTRLGGTGGARHRRRLPQSTTSRSLVEESKEGMTTTILRFPSLIFSILLSQGIRHLARMASPDENRERGIPGDAPLPGPSTPCGPSTSYAAEGASPDLLRNTPSNIARLEDAIENCEARRKYLARTRSPSDGEDVRWYFCKLPLGDKELSGSVPQTEIVGKGDYFRFSMRDSLTLEASFLEREEELLAYWWREYAQCSEGPRGSLVRSDDSDSEDLYKVEEERVGVPVKGGLYEVDLMRRHCFPVYWSGENRRVLRGHWFAHRGGLDWIPLREDVSEQLELAYNCQVWRRRTFQPSGLFAARIDLQGSTPDLHALFTGEDDTWEAWLVFDTGPKLGSNTIKLRRGFCSSGSAKLSQDELRQQKEEEMDDYCSQVPVGHLVFMVHGIGQKLEKANLVDDVVDFRRVMRT